MSSTRVWSDRGGNEGSSSWPVTTVNPRLAPRWVTGMPAAAGTLTALVTPGTTSTGTPRASQASRSSPPRPNT